MWGVMMNIHHIIYSVYEDEKIFKGTLRNMLTKQFSWLSVMVVISSKGGVKDE